MTGKTQPSSSVQILKGALKDTHSDSASIEGEPLSAGWAGKRVKSAALASELERRKGSALLPEVSLLARKIGSINGATPTHLNLEADTAGEDSLSAMDYQKIKQTFDKVNGAFYHLGDFHIDDIETLVNNLRQCREFGLDGSGQGEQIQELWNDVCNRAVEYLCWSREVTVPKMSQTTLKAFKRQDKLDHQVAKLFAKSKNVKAFAKSQTQAKDHREKVVNRQVGIEKDKLATLPGNKKLRDELQGCFNAFFESIASDHWRENALELQLLTGVDIWVRNLLYVRMCEVSGVDNTAI